VTLKSAIKAGVLAASLVPAFIFTVGCNTDDTTASSPAAGPKKDVNAPGGGGAPNLPKPADNKKP
jgi:hypothetical protein